jgi:hypothetical protein
MDELAQPLEFLLVEDNPADAKLTRKAARLPEVDGSGVSCRVESDLCAKAMPVVVRIWSREGSGDRQ